ncbi:MAG: PqqD family protein [Nocardioides sp.]
MSTWLRAAPEVAWVAEADAMPYPEEGPVRIFLARLPDGVPVVLADSAAAIWGVVAPGVRRADVVRAVAEVTGVPQEMIAADVASFVADLLERGLIDESEPPA